MRGTWQTTDGGSSGGVIVAVIVALIVVGSGAASAMARALVTILIIIGSIIGLAVLGGIAWLIWRARQDRPGRPIEARPVVQLPLNPRPQLEVSRKSANGPAP